MGENDGQVTDLPVIIKAGCWEEDRGHTSQLTALCWARGGGACAQGKV